MLGRLSRRVATVPALGGELSLMPVMTKSLEPPPRSFVEEVDDDGEADSPNALVVEAKRIGDVGFLAKALGSEGVLDVEAEVLIGVMVGDAMFTSPSPDPSFLLTPDLIGMLRGSMMRGILQYRPGPAVVL